MIDRRRTYFQKNLKTLLVNRGLKYSEFAELCDISEDTVKSYFRKNATLPNADTLEVIVAQFDLHYDDLLQADFNMLLEESLEKATPKVQFRNAMIEVGYDDMIAMIDYLQFIGYQISFYAEEVTYSRLEKKEAEKHFELLKQKYETLYLQKQKELRQIQNKMEEAECTEKNVEMIEQIEKISKQYFEAEMELINIDFCLNTMNSKSKNMTAGYKMGMNRAIGMLGELGKLPATVRKRRLKELGVYVVIYLPDEIEENKKINIYDFYMMCEDFNKSIAEKIAGA